MSRLVKYTNSIDSYDKRKFNKYPVKMLDGVIPRGVKYKFKVKTEKVGVGYPGLSLYIIKNKNMKKCNKCQQEKLLTEYRKHKQTRDGLTTYCKQCLTSYVVKWQKEKYGTHKKKIDARYKANNPEKVKEIQKKSFQKRYKENYEGIIKPRYKYKGVYGLFSGGKCLYIGESTQIRQRLNYHHCSIRNPKSVKIPSEIEFYKKFSNHIGIVGGIIEECDNHKKREKYWIDYYQPEYND